jgi:hypothetical protein
LVNAVWGTSSTSVWAVGAGGSIVHWDGKGWTNYASNNAGDLLGIFGTSKDDVWAVGAKFVPSMPPGRQAGAALHWDGHSWTELFEASTIVFRAASGSAPDDIYFVGGASTESTAYAYHWDGTAGTQVNYNPNTIRYNGVFSASATDVWAIGEWATGHWDGQSWINEPVVERLENVWGAGANDIWRTGSYGIQHWTGNGWDVAIKPGYICSGDCSLRGIWGLGPGRVWVVGGDGATNKTVFVRLSP